MRGRASVTAQPRNAVRLMLRGAELIAISAAVLFGIPQPASADCVLWDLNGQWEFWQSNKTKATFELQQDGAGKIVGKGHFYTKAPDGTSFGEAGEGTVTGNMAGNRFSVVAKWSAAKSGEYSGEIGPEGQLSGFTSDLQRPEVRATWHEWAGRRAKCMTAQTPPSTRTDPHYQQDTNMPGNDLRSFETTKGADAECSIACANDAKCKAWTWVKPGIQAAKGKCWLKHAVPNAVADTCCISGLRGNVIKAQGKPAKVIKANPVSKALDPVDIFNSPTDPRHVLGAMPTGAKGTPVEHHPHGWCRLDRIDKSDPPGIVSGWVADDHLSGCKVPPTP